MLIVYDSRTGNVKRFVSKLHRPSIRIEAGLMVNEPYVLLTYTTGFGEVPQTTQQFLEGNSRWLAGVAVSGNMNWGSRYGMAGDVIAARYGVPLLHKFELSGTVHDVHVLNQEVETIVNAIAQVVTA